MFGQATQTADSSKLWGWWSSIKSKIGAMQRLPGDIEQKKGELIVLSRHPSVSKLPTMHPTRVSIRAALAKLIGMKDEAETVAAKIAKHLPDWRSAAGETSGLGVAPIILGVAAAGALAFVATKGLELLKQYARESQVIEALKAKSLTLEEAQSLITVTKPPPLIEAGLGLGVGMTVVPLALGALALFWVFGMPKSAKG